MKYDLPFPEFLDALPEWQADMIRRAHERTKELNNLTPISTPFLEHVTKSNT